MSAEPKSQTAWERWELASLDAPGAPRTKSPQPSPKTTPSAPSPPLQLPTAAEIEAMHAQAHEEGRRLGYEEGRAEASAEAQRLAAMAQRLEAALAELDQQVGDELLALAIEIARSVVGQAIAVDHNLVREVVRQALVELPHQHAVIHVNPEDAALLRATMGEQFAHAGHRIHEDEAVARGGCVIEAAGSRVDATVPTRWRRILENIGVPADWIVGGKP